MGVCSTVFIVLLILKLGEIVTLSWWWVFSPLVVLVAWWCLVIPLIFGVGFMYAIVKMFKKNELN